MNILIVPDIPNWSTDSMADGIINSLKDMPVTFYKKFPEDIIFPDDFDYYDLIYLMIPGYIKTIYKDYYHKIVSTFHGGPGTEGQADDIIKKNKRIKRLSYVSSEVKKRVTQYKEYNDLYFTPHGVDIVKFSDNDVIKSDTFGFAGHANYLLKDNLQSEHRRGFWIIDAWKKLKFDLRIAGGMTNHLDNINQFLERYPNINCESYSKEKIPGFYRKIDIYLIPDKHAGGPMPALEAGSMNIPLITTNCGLLADSFIDKEHGLLIDNYNDFEESIIWAKNNHEKMIEMGLNWGNYVRNNRSWNAVKDFWIDFFDIKNVKPKNATPKDNDFKCLSKSIKENNQLNIKKWFNQYTNINY